MVQKYQNEIPPIFYYGISTKTSEKDLKIPNLQALTLGRIIKITLYYLLSRLRWDYLTKSWWNMTEMAGDRLKAFQWIQQHGATLGQVGRVRDA